MNPDEALELLDWKRRIFSLYAEIRDATAPEAAWERWRQVRDELFRSHPQSPLLPADRSSFTGLAVYPYDRRYRVQAEVKPAEARRYDIATSGDETMAFTRIGTAAFVLLGHELELEVYWLAAYGGGLFVPFRDATSGNTTYGAGRYLLDTVKGADLGSSGGALVLDFNFAYNPSCSYDPRWVCPLAPPPNRLDMPIEAGEKQR